jgi:hypothetical protein
LWRIIADHRRGWLSVEGCGDGDALGRTWTGGGRGGGGTGGGGGMGGGTSASSGKDEKLTMLTPDTALRHQGDATRGRDKLAMLTPDTALPRRGAGRSERPRETP